MDYLIGDGWAVHLHHDVLFEWCYNYAERVDAIKRDKPESEQAVRLRLFKMLPQEALDDLPERIIKANAEWDNDGDEWEKANDEWAQSDKDAFHKKWCGCTEWDGREIRFGGSDDPL